MSTWLMYNFQDPNSYYSLVMILFHDYIMMWLLMILVFIFYVMIWFLNNKMINLKILYNHLLEVVWTLMPIVILLLMALPSLKILYMFEEVIYTSMTVKILGHQWYWSYEYSDFKNVMFDSFMLNYEDNSSMFRLLDVDNRLVLPIGVMIRGLVSSYDVIHSWAMPSMGVKVDATPGRINQFYLNIFYPGLFYGQCSEICGLNHSFMPIILEAVKMKNFMHWINSLM